MIIHIYTYIYIVTIINNIYIYIHMYTYVLITHDVCGWRRRQHADPASHDVNQGNHLSNTTCLTQVFFKSGEYRIKLW